MSAVFEVLNGHQVTCFDQSDRASAFFTGLTMKSQRAAIIMVTEVMVRGKLTICEELVAERVATLSFLGW